MFDWDDAFANAAYVPQAGALRDKWMQKSAAFRADIPHAACTAEFDVPYGDHPRQVMDVFRPKGACHGTVMFVHGGYWHLLSKDAWSHFATSFTSQRWALAIPSYPLAPEVGIADITQSIRAAVLKLAEICTGPLRLTGHSAGGHLVSRMMCQGVLPPGVMARIDKVVAISPVVDLPPLMLTTMNDILALDLTEAEDESPVLLDPDVNTKVRFWVGATERPEFLRQNRLIAERWIAKGAKVSEMYQNCQNHYSVVDQLDQSDSPLVQDIIG